MRWESAPSPDVPGRFAVVRIAAGNATVELDGVHTKRKADELARKTTASYIAAQARYLDASKPPHERPIPRGFYTDKDAA